MLRKFQVATTAPNMHFQKKLYKIYHYYFSLLKFILPNFDYVQRNTLNKINIQHTQCHLRRACRDSDLIESVTVHRSQLDVLTSNSKLLLETAIIWQGELQLPLMYTCIGIWNLNLNRLYTWMLYRKMCSNNSTSVET